MTRSDSNTSHPHSLNQLNRPRIISTLMGFPLFCALFMFLPAGTVGWTKGWLFIAVFLISETLAAIYLWKTNPELLIARSHPHSGTKWWDKLLLSGLFPAMSTIFVVAALDDGRFQWSILPVSVVLLGYLLFFVGFVIGVWMGQANKFAEPTVRIQTDRGHTVVDSGPYRFVRHPGYAGGTVMFFGIALALGSIWAMIPALVTGLLLVIRTQLEDRTLQEELQGYKEYATRVRYKLVPYVW